MGQIKFKPPVVKGSLTITKPFSIPAPGILAANYYATCIGYVCKKELALEKATKIPLRIRVGSLQQCNYLEGKRY